MSPIRLRKKLQSVWFGMRYRCENPAVINYAYYGGRGIAVDPVWINFDNFYQWAIQSGYDGTKQLDRIDNNGNYSPENCRWATAKENANNRSSTRFITAWGERKSLHEWTKDSRCKINYAGLKRRLNRKWRPEEALSTVVCKRKRGVGWLREKEL